MKRVEEPQYQCEHCGRIGTEDVIKYCETMHDKKISMLESLVVGATIVNPHMSCKGKIVELKDNIVLIEYDVDSVYKDLSIVRYTRDTVYSWINETVKGGLANDK